jgi:5-methylcytosine-specific restriction endonuclease McrA
MNPHEKGRRHKRQKQKRINFQLKTRLFGHLAFAPCCYCRVVFLYDELTVEHMVPLCLGGTNKDSNIALACAPCNRARGKIAWHQKQNSPEYLDMKKELARKHYEQYSPEYHRQNRDGSV